MAETQEGLTMTPETRARILHLIDTAKEDDTIVVAISSQPGEMLIHTILPTPGNLVDIGRSLLSQAKDDLDSPRKSEDDEMDDDEAELFDKLTECLEILPDPHEDVT